MYAVIPSINYKRIVNAINYYQEKGYQYKETPWIVSFKAYNATKPPSRADFYTLGGYLVASGEQGFIEELLSGDVLTKHCTITPCFREEEVLDETHYRYFLKVELINTEVSTANLQRMISDAVTFFSKERVVQVIKMDTPENSYDIVDKETGVELGSYGIRTVHGYSFIYGTGLAEPRFQVVCNYKNNKIQ